MTLEELPPVLNVDEVASLYRVSKWSIYQRVKAGEIPALSLGRSLRFSRAAIERLLEDGTPLNGNAPLVEDGAPMERISHPKSKR